MRIILISLALTIVGCGSVTQPDLGGTNDDLSAAGDMSGSSSDMAKSSSSGDALLPLASKCTANGQCQSGTCAPYKMGTEMLCSFSCTANMSAPQCTSPSPGKCNGMGYCMFPGM